MIHLIAHEKTERLTAELRAIVPLAAEAARSAAAHATAESYCADFAASVRGLELMERLGAADAPLDVLDIGAGDGQSSVLMAIRGHRVSCLEPSPEMCALVDSLATRFGLAIGVYQGTAESADALAPKGFDACVFNSSLHHCDDPVRALKNCRALLRPGGRVIVVNEPLLRFYRSHRWFERRLHSHPVAMGHYGGNEHSYHHGEYIAMLREAGFGDIRAYLSVRNTQPRAALRDLQWRHIEGQPVYGTTALRIRYAWLVALNAVLRAGPPGRAFGHLVMRLSLVQTSYVAT